MRIVFIGPTGVGKGTQSKRLAAHLGIVHLSTGEMLRQAIESGTEAGRISEAYLSRGELAPDAVVLQMMDVRLAQADCERGFLLDGFPRTIVQARGLDDFLQAQGRRLSAVVELKVDREQIIQRLASRGRADDNPENIRERLVRYAEQTAPLIDYYRQRGLLHEIDGMGTPDVVFDRIKQVLATDSANN